MSDESDEAAVRVLATFLGFTIQEGSEHDARGVLEYTVYSRQGMARQNMHYSLFSGAVRATLSSTMWAGSPAEWIADCHGRECNEANSYAPCSLVRAVHYSSQWAALDVLIAHLARTMKP